MYGFREPTKSRLERSFEVWLSKTDLPSPVREYQFAPGRRWRFDFAWLEQRVAVEIDGLLKTGGRHQTYDGFIKDCEKKEAALRLGWKVYAVPGPWIAKGQRIVWRLEVMETLADLLEVPMGDLAFRRSGRDRQLAGA